MHRVCASCGRRFDRSVTRCPDDGSPTLVYVPEDDLIGRSIDGRFTVRSLLGKGGMGAVYTAHQHSMDRDVALKVLRRDAAQSEDAVKRFFREARAVSRLASPHTIVVHDFGQSEEGLLYIAMELLRGRPLNRVLSDLGGPMEPAKAVGIAQQILDSLTEAHQVGVIHRDLKPDNVFILEGAGRKDFVKVLDFGIAKLTGGDGTGSHLTATGLAFGTPTYMSPEQAQAKELDPRTDLYSLGVILFEMLAGKPPFDGETPFDVMMKKVQERPPTVYHVNPDVRVPVRLERLLASLLAKDRNARPPTAEAAMELLALAMDEESQELVHIPDVLLSEGITSQLAAVDRDADAASRQGPEPPMPDAGPGVARRQSAEFPVPRPGQKVLPWRWVVLAVLLLAAGLVGFLLWERGEPGAGGASAVEVAPPADKATVATPSSAEPPAPAPASAEQPAPVPPAPEPVIKQPGPEPVPAPKPIPPPRPGRRVAPVQKKPVKDPGYNLLD